VDASYFGGFTTGSSRVLLGNPPAIGAYQLDDGIALGAGLSLVYKF
jgi:hypothetical protein